jgi:putative component of membrane protein insertase Oxa1/YidC/SpoIIIJ protein YidD
MNLSSKQNSGVVVVSSIPENSSNWVFIAALLSFALFPKRHPSQMMEPLVTRPKLNGLRAVKVVFLHMLVGLGVGILGVKLQWVSGGFGALCSFAYWTTVLLTNSRAIVIWFIRLYQYRAPAVVRLRCKLHPSCSEYMVAAVQKSGAISGVRQGLKRVRACGSPEALEII